MRKFMVRAMALVCLASLTFAYERTITWTPPTFYVDGTALLEQDLDYYTLYCDGLVLTTVDSIIGTWTTLINFPEQPGGHECYLTVTTLAGQESAASNLYNFTNQHPVPNPPVVQW